MTRILLLDPVGVDIHGPLEQQVAQRVVGPDTIVEVRNLDGLPATVFVPPVWVVAPRLVEAARKAEMEGFDAIGIACCSDPGLHDVRDAVSIPVTGPFEAMAARVSRTASLQPLSVFFNVAPAGPGESPFTWEDWGPALVERYGIDGKLAPSHTINTPRPQVDFAGADAAPADVGAALIDAMRTGLVADGGSALQAAEADGAHSVFLACTYWANLTDVLDRKSTRLNSSHARK